MTNQLEGKLAIVTGGSQGIGRAIAECMMNSGAKVIVGDKKPIENSNLYWHLLDVTDETSVKDFINILPIIMVPYLSSLITLVL